MAQEQAIVGWAALSPVSGRACYAGVAEVGVYVAAAARRRGVGLALLEAVIESAEAHGIWTLQGATIAENAASLALQARCGFRIVGRRERIGKLAGIWRDTVLTERRSKKVGVEQETRRGMERHRPGSGVPNAEQILRNLHQCVEKPGERMQKLRQIARILRSIGNYRWVGLYAVDYGRNLVCNLVWEGPAPPEYPEFPLDKGLTGRALAMRATVNVGDVAGDPDYLTALETTKSEIIVPILDPEGSMVGTIDVESELERAFTPQVQAFLESCAGVIRPLWPAR